MIKLCLKIGCCVLSMLLTYAHAANTTQVKSNLERLTFQINRLQNQLREGVLSREQIEKKLHTTEIEQAQADQELLRLKNIFIAQDRKISSITSQITALSVKLKHYQHNVAQNLRAWQRVPAATPLQLILHPEKVEIFRRQAIYENYLLTATHKLIKDVARTQINLNQQQSNLKLELAALKQAHSHWLARKQILTKNKTLHTNQLVSINQNIQDNSATLKNYQKNQHMLSGLLSSLAKSSVLQTNKPITIMQHKLQHPLQLEHVKTEKSHQGVVFFAPENTSVYAIYPGKVVFAEWLNGYGYLLIIDHGWGFMSLYANNKSLLKHKGNIVHTKEKIAIVGHSGTLQKSGLYFELRHHGKPVSSSLWWATRSV